MASISRLQLLGAIIISVVVYNEWISYVLRAKSWIKLEKSDDSISILLVADPQILSILSEPLYPLSIAASWDANRFVSKAYGYAVQHTNPDIIIFLGDLINDGSIASNDEYISLVADFKRLFPQPSCAKVVFFIAGDNDVGGEGSDEITNMKITRFQSSFNSTDVVSYRFLDIYHLNNIYGSNIVKQNNDGVKRHPIVVSHYPITPAPKKEILAKIIEIAPSVIFSAHDHDSYRFVSLKENPIANQFHLLRADDTSTLVMNLDNLELNEINVPTCSYRMGKHYYGFGYAVIRRDDVLEYCVLWFPSRFAQLWVYVILCSFTISFYLWPFVRLFSQYNELNSDKVHNI